MKDFHIIDEDITGRLIENVDAINQAINLRLSIHRGSFMYDENLGSRLYLLLREKPSRWNELGRTYVEEALKDEYGIKVVDIGILKLNKKQIEITIYYIWDGGEYSTEVVIE